jgi:gluconokinase
LATPIVIGLDLGTTACKAVALAADGSPLAVASGSYSMRTPQPGWAEQSPEEIWSVARAVLRDLAARIPLERIAGLTLCGAMHSLLPVAEDGRPLALASIWADGRATEQAQALRQHANARALYQRTGCPLQPMYHPARLRWWHEEARDTARQAACWVGIKDWIGFQLAGTWATDVGLASTTGLLDIHTLAWDAEALALAGVTPERLPHLVSSLDVIGSLRPEIAAEIGLPAGLPIIAGSSDGGLANLGAGVVEPGQAVVTVGTSGAVRRVVERPWLDPAERTWCYVLTEGRWFAGGAINNGGLALRWVRERLYGEFDKDAAYARLYADAAAVPPGAEGLLLLPYFAGERSPHWNPEVRALIHGLGLEHTRAHLARAVLEGIAFCLADVWEALVQGEPPSVYVTGGLTRSDVWVQILADVLGTRVAQLETREASAIGAATMGHRALGHIPTLEALAHRAKPSSIFEPNPAHHRLYTERHREFQTLYRKLAGGT